MTIKVGSDFSGVGAFDQALIRLGIEYKTVFACDMDLYARETYMANYGEPDYYPFNVYDREIPKQPLDIYMTSPPCQAFSLAGKRKGEDDKRGLLFYNSHEFIQKNKPRYFIFENVKGLLSDDSGKTFQRWVDMLGGKSVNGNPVIFAHDESVPYHIYWKVLNAKNYGVPQNRERVFIIGIRDDAGNTFRFPKPFPLKKRFKDVLEKEVDEKYYLSDKMINSFINRPQSKDYLFQPMEVDSDKPTPCLTARYYKLSSTDPYVKVKSATKKGYEVATENDSINFSVPNSETRRGRVGKSVAQTLDTQCNQGIIVDKRKFEKGGVCAYDYSTNREQEQRVWSENGCSPTVTTANNDTLKIAQSWIKGSLQKNQPKQTNGVSPFLTSVMGMGGGHTPIHNYDYKIRRLTPRECFRLMDFPDTFKIDQVSNTQAYKQAGNSIVVGVLAEIINKLKINQIT